ncbi:MAG: hypothetical protein HY237_13680, partial [Acidobacteria bacterium]|nr:hypothetical protein [Acidobacteriota bacterium]
GAADLAPRKVLRVRARDDRGKEKNFSVLARVDTPEELSYFRHGGILQYVLRQML